MEKYLVRPYSNEIYIINVEAETEISVYYNNGTTRRLASKENVFDSEEDAKQHLIERAKEKERVALDVYNLCAKETQSLRTKLYYSDENIPQYRPKLFVTIP